MFDAEDSLTYLDDIPQEMLETADKDGTGSLDIIEFLQMMREKVKEQNKEKEIAEAFTVFDTVNQNMEKKFLDGVSSGWKWLHRPKGVSSHDEVSWGASVTGGNRCKLFRVNPMIIRMIFKDILDEADKDKNGLIDYKEFADMMAPPGRS